METVEVKSHEGGIYWRDSKGRVLMQIGNLPVHEGMCVATDGKYIYGREHTGVSPYILPNKTGGGIPLYYENTQKGYFNLQSLKYERSDNREPQTDGWKRKCLVNTAESEWAFPICEESNVNHEFIYEFDADMLIGNVKGDKQYYTYQIVGDGVAYHWNTKLKSQAYSHTTQDTTVTSYTYESEANPEKNYSTTTTKTSKRFSSYAEYSFEGNGTLKEAGGEAIDTSKYYGVWYGFPRVVIRDSRTNSIVKETKIKFYKLIESMLEKYRHERTDLFVWDDMRLIDSTVFMRMISQTKTGNREYPIYRLDGKTRRVGMFLTVVMDIEGIMQCTRHFPSIYTYVSQKDRYYDAQPTIWDPDILWNWQWEKTTRTTKTVSYDSMQSNCNGRLEFWTRIYLETSFDEDTGEIDLAGAYTETIWEYVYVTGTAARAIYNGVKTSEKKYKNYEYWHGHRVQISWDVVDSSSETYAELELQKNSAISFKQGLKEYKSEKDVIYLLQDGYYASYGGCIYNDKKQLLMKFEVKHWRSVNLAWVFAFCDAGNGVYLIHCDAGFTPFRASLFAFQKTKNGYEQIDGGLSLYELVECRNKKLRKFKAIQQYIGGG